MILAYKAIYNTFGSGIYHKPRYISKSKSYESHNRNIGLFSGNDTIMAGYFIEVHRDLCMKKLLLVKTASAGFNSISLNYKF